MSTVVSAIEIAAAPKIMLAGKEWPVVMLATRQLRLVIPRMVKVIKNFDQVEGLTEQQIDDLIHMVHAAISRASPQVTMDMFLDMPISLKELMDAIPVVAQQTGVLASGEPGAGEAKAGSPPTGI